MTDYLHPLAAPFRMEGNMPGAVILIHGWTGSPAHLRVLGAYLNGAGYTVNAPLLEGHGTKLEDMVGTGWRDWVRTATEAAVSEASAGGPIHLVGLSMGGIISLLLAPVLEAASVTTINAPLRVWNKQMKLAGMYRGSDRIEPSDPPVPAPSEMQKYQHQYDGTPVGTVAELYDLMRAAKRNVDRVTCPTLIIQSKTDETVRPESAEIIYDGVSSSDKGLVWLENSRHVALLDDERDVIARSILEHLNGA